MLHCSLCRLRWIKGDVHVCRMGDITSARNLKRVSKVTLVYYVMQLLPVLVQRGATDIYRQVLAGHLT